MHWVKLLVLVTLVAACGEVVDNSDEADATVPSPDAMVPTPDAADPCNQCDVNATCSDGACECNLGYEGDGVTCTDVNECATNNGDCHADANCTNTDGSRTCMCKPGFEGDGIVSCTPWFDENRRGCAILEAEHPGYTNIDRNVALCGNRYDDTNIAAACHTGWHVCLVSEWHARYPTDRPYPVNPGDPDLIGPTIGPLTSWGAAQADRCVGDVWQARQPENTNTWGSNVCHDPDDTAGENSIGADYNPWNNGKFLMADDGTTILQGRDALGNPNWGSWDVSFDTTTEIDGYAVYCCLD